jgi:flagellar hook-length control protein FliK
MRARAVPAGNGSASAQATPALPDPSRQGDGGKQPREAKPGAAVAVAAASVVAKPVVQAAQAQAATQGGSSDASSSPAPPAQTQTGSHGGSGSEAHGQAAAQQGAAPAGASGSSQAQAQSVQVVTAPVAGGNGSAGTQAAAPGLPEGLVRTSVRLQEAVDAVRATFTAAAGTGISTARISLEPASLGGIKISLSQTADGLVARVTTDHPEAAQTLQQSAGDLRRSLEASGLSLLRLDIGSSGQQSLAGFTGSNQSGSQTGSGWYGGAGADASADAEEQSTPTELTIELSSGSLVNVLA